MKKRLDYVSNSSSTSYIVIVNEGKESQPRAWDLEESPLYVPNEHGHHQFGWEFVDYNLFDDKLNFAAIQLLILKVNWKNAVYYMQLDADKCENHKVKFQNAYKLLKDVCKKEFKIKIKLNDTLIQESVMTPVKGKTQKWYHLEYSYYIDHQSSAEEGENLEIFDSYEMLRDFLKYEQSMVVGGNDNDQRYD